jgi:hypothetical protein
MNSNKKNILLNELKLFTTTTLSEILTMGKAMVKKILLKNKYKKY